MTRFLPLLLLCSLVASSAQARKHTEFSYPLSRVWTAAVRLMRIDLASPITEKDKDEGYFLFEYPHSGRTYSGSVEVVALNSDRGPRVRVAIQVAGLPSYVEAMMLSKLERKLKREFGSPVRGERKPDQADKPNDSEDDEGQEPGQEARDSDGATEGSEKGH